MFKRFDVVRLKIDLPAEGISAGTVVTILDVYDAPPGYEIEVADTNGATLFFGGVALDAVETLIDPSSGRAIVEID